MARKTRPVTIDAAGGRDAGKSFLITEMPAIQGEKWAMSVSLAVAGAFPLADQVEDQGMGQLAFLGLKAFGLIPKAERDPLLDELMNSCVQFVPNASESRVMLNWASAGSQIEEISTILKLRAEAFDIHTDFFTVGRPYLLALFDLLKRKLLTIQTSLEQSGQSSPPGEQQS